MSDRVADEHGAEIFSPCAAAALYRKAAFDAVGGFDEDFFCSFEDVDLGFRLRLAGHRARYVSTAVVRHVGGASARAAGNDFAVFYGHRNLAWCFVKNMPAPLLDAFLPAHLLQTILNLMTALTRGRFRAMVAAKWRAVCGLRRCWRKRQIVQAQRRASLATIWQSLDKSLFRRRMRPACGRPSRP
ncbi:MAG: glycosyltransferase family 2 protein [Planctomycetia bacterium]